MATYAELRKAIEDDGLARTVLVACIIAADTIRAEATSVTNHPNRLIWAKQVFQNPEGEAKRMLWSVVSKNRSFTLAQIVSAADATVQTAVDASVDTFATGV